LEAAELGKIKTVYYECLQTNLDTNLKYLTDLIKDETGKEFISFDSFQKLFDYLGSTGDKYCIIIDEYCYLKMQNRKDSNYVDSLFQTIIDRMPANVKLILCGSYISIMRELLERGRKLNFMPFSAVFRTSTITSTRISRSPTTLRI